MAEHSRRTAVVFGRLSARELRLQAARTSSHGLQVMTIEQLACRLAGGFHRGIEDEQLRIAIQSALTATPLGELDAIKQLPGMVDACAGTLRKVWTSALSLENLSGHPRVDSIRSLEEAVVATFGFATKRPSELADRAQQRVQFAPAALGTVDFIGMTELEPCWRPLVSALAGATRVRWIAGARAVPDWLDKAKIEVVTEQPAKPSLSVFSASTALHEALESMRWARDLISSGTAKPWEIGIASVATGEFDDYFLALREEADFELNFVHGIKVTSTRDGQSAAALADILLRGLSQLRFRRLVRLLGSSKGPFSDLPQGWLQILPRNAPVSSTRAWDRLFQQTSAEDWPDKVDHAPSLRALVSNLLKAADDPSAAGSTFLSRGALAVWKKALAAGPATSLDLSLQSMRQDDSMEACVSVAWMPASSLAASPRRFVRLLGLNSSRWPRRRAEDSLLSDHIIPQAQLDPLPADEADRRDFETILATTAGSVDLSFSRRDSDGRLMGRSGLLQGMPESTYLRRHRQAEHAFSESDRLSSRPQEFRTSVQAKSAANCWSDWQRRELTEHDGMVQPDHPVVQATLGRMHSATSLSLLLRNPLGFVWRYGLKLRTPEDYSEQLRLEAVEFGNLVHETLEVALQCMVVDSKAGQHPDFGAVVEVAVRQVAAAWEERRSVPPQVLWKHTQNEAAGYAELALQATRDAAAEGKSFGEVPFGGAEPKVQSELPWDASQQVEVPGTGFHINGYIDRIDIASSGSKATVVDYKTGRPPEKAIVLNGGKELQRCLYAFAVNSLLGAKVEISASLLYLQDGQTLTLNEPETTLQKLQGYLALARTSLLSGAAPPGIDAGDEYDDMSFALPANSASGYMVRKAASVQARLGDVANVWEEM